MDNYVLETEHLLVSKRSPQDVSNEHYYEGLFPEILQLDPIVGESRDPVFFSVFVKDVNKHIAVCCFYNFNEHNVEIGVRIFIPSYWGKGHGTELVGGLCFYVFSIYPNINAILAKTPIYNTRAFKCYQGCGFTQYSRAVIDGYDMVFMKRERSNPNEHPNQQV